MNPSTSAFRSELSAVVSSLQSLSPPQIMQKILHSGRITTIERQWLLQAGQSELQLSPTELSQLRLIHDRLRMGLIKVIDV